MTGIISAGLPDDGSAVRGTTGVHGGTGTTLGTGAVHGTGTTLGTGMPPGTGTTPGTGMAVTGGTFPTMSEWSAADIRAPSTMEGYPPGATSHPTCAALHAACRASRMRGGRYTMRLPHERATSRDAGAILLT